MEPGKSLNFSPHGGSILTTSAPKSDITIVATPPAGPLVKSRTVIPSKTFAMASPEYPPNFSANNPGIPFPVLYALSLTKPVPVCRLHPGTVREAELGLVVFARRTLAQACRLKTRGYGRPDRALGNGRLTAETRFYQAWSK